MIADWFNYLLLALYLHAIGLLTIYLVKFLRKEGHTPHTGLAISLLIWIVGMTMMRISSIFRIINDRSCNADNLTTCIGGGTIDMLVYNFGVGVNAFGLVCVLRILASMQGEYAWVRVVTQSVLLATVISVITYFRQIPLLQ